MLTGPFTARQLGLINAILVGTALVLFAFDPADAQHLYIGHHGGLLETTDGGRTWVRQSSAEPTR